MSEFTKIACALIAAAVPVLFWFRGRQWFGSQTHPAALFILSWFAAVLVLSLGGVFTEGSGKIALAWVAITFTVLSIARRMRQKSVPAANSKDSTQN